jgi:acylphosphatase
MIVSGFVQGVGYRYFIYREATEIGLNGYTKNLWSGEVEIVVEGEEWQITSLFEKAKQGPMRSRVSNIKIIKENSKSEFTKFEIRH